MDMFEQLLTDSELHPICYKCNTKTVIYKKSYYHKIVFVSYRCMECNNVFSLRFIVKQLYARKWDKNAR